MKWRRIGTRALALAALFVVTTHREARADEKTVCVAASEKAQLLRNGGHLTEARDQLAICGRSECPKLIAQDCAQWTADVLQMLPSVVPSATDKQGRDLVDVRVSIDGKPATTTLNGKALLVDPGVHAFRWETRGAPAIDQQVVIRQGEKNRILTVSFGTADDPKPKGEVVPAPRRSLPIAALIVGGLGIIGVGVGAYIGLDANADARSLRQACAPNCNPSDIDDVRQRYVIAGVTAGIGGAALATGIVLYLLHGSGETKTGKSPVLPSVSWTPGGMLGTTGFRF